MKSDMLDNLNKFLDSEEGQKMVEEWFDKDARLEAMRNSQLERFKNKFGSKLIEIVDKVEAKYASDKYKDNWLGRGIEPPEDLYFFLFEYAAKYGRKATEEEFEKYGNMFTSELYFIEGIFFNKMNGQGTVVQIERQTNS